MLAALAWSLAAALYLFSPLLVSAALSGVVLRGGLFRALAAPIDGTLTVRGRRLFGDSKTWRGVVTAVVGCVATVWMQRALASTVPRELALADYESLSPLAFGAAMGAGAMLGELPNSFVKRQLGIAPGKTTKGAMAVVFYLWDQVDLLTGAWPLVACWVRPSLGVVIASFALTLALHPLVALVGYGVGARKTAR